jgi:hypothetical protein
MLRYLHGEPLESDRLLEAAIDLEDKVPSNVAIDAGDVAGYSMTQCLIKGNNLDVDEARQRISEMGLDTG